MHEHAAVEVLTPTTFEWLVARAVIGGTPVRRIGVGATAPREDSEAGVIVFGFAGGLVPAQAPGTVLIPWSVSNQDGTSYDCDVDLVFGLLSAARTSGITVGAGRLLTSTTMVTAPKRASWAEQGFVAVDMESALVAKTAKRFAVIRVVLDTPERPISESWLQPWKALQDPSLGQELLWMSLNAPRLAYRGARVLARSLEQVGSGGYPP